MPLPDISNMEISKALKNNQYATSNSAKVINGRTIYGRTPNASD
jgi:hypothetical protein